MSTVFKGQPDARQTDAAALAPQHTLFRKRYRQMSADEVALHDAIKDKADELAALFDRVEAIISSRQAPNWMASTTASQRVATNNAAHVTIALRHLEDAVFRAIKALSA